MNASTQFDREEWLRKAIPLVERRLIWGSYSLFFTGIFMIILTQIFQGSDPLWTLGLVPILFALIFRWLVKNHRVARYLTKHYGE